MTLLALDVGNIETTIGLFEGDDLVFDFAVASDERRTADEWYLTIEGLLDRTELPNVSMIAMCCTVPQMVEQFRSCFSRYYGHAPAWIVGPGVKTGVPIHTDNPREVGADRIVNALAAAAIYGGPAIVVDLNSNATVFDVVDDKGSYIGGAIAPGVQGSLEALARRSAQLRSVELVEPRRVIGKTTVEAVQAGTIFGFAGLVDSVVQRMIVELDADPDHVTVIATGSQAATVIEQCETITVRDPQLTLTGLRLVADRNRR